MVTKGVKTERMRDRGVICFSAPAASVDTTNMNTLAGMLSTPGMTLAIQRIETAPYQKKLGGKRFT